MQSINVTVINPLCGVAFLGTAATCLSLAVTSIFRWREPGVAYVLTGSLLYLVGTVLVTIVFNAPRNDALAALAPDNVESADLWAGYVAGWTAWNHVRTIAALGAAAALTFALYLSRE
jgi:uncharacterized membrane protein